MKEKGIDLAQLTSELEYRMENRRDVSVNTEGMALNPPDGVANPWRLVFNVMNGDGKSHTESLPVTSHALSQITAATRFPFPELLRIVRKGTRREIDTLSTFLSVRLQENPHARKVRTVSRFWEDPEVVAFVDARFSCPSAYSVLTAILGLGLSIKGLSFLDANLTDNYMTVRMMAPPREGIASGLMFEYSEVGLVNAVRPILLTQNTMVVPTNHHVIGWDEINLDLAKQCLMGARSAVKRYAELSQRPVPPNTDVPALLLELGLCRDEIRKVVGHFVKSDGPTHQNLVNAIAKYAALASKLSYERTVELECIAGKVMDFTNDTFKLYVEKPSAVTTAPKPAKEGQKNGAKEAPQSGKKQS